MDAEDLLLREILGIREAGRTQATARWIRSQQKGDGSWATYYGGPPDLSTTIEAYLALRLAGDEAGSPHMLKAATVIRDRGGIAASRVFTRIWLAMVGLWSWDELPVMPPELILLPSRLPVSIYDFGCWARQTVVPLCVVSAHRLVRRIPVTLNELAADTAPTRTRPGDLGGRAFTVLDKLLHRYERHPVKALRRLALRQATEWILARQEADGGWGGIQPPWVYSLLALHLAGYALDHPAMVAGLQGLDRFTITEDGPDGPICRLEACQSPVWDTALALVALQDAGASENDETVRAAAEWLLSERVQAPGDWQQRRPELPRSSWAFEFDNDAYPDVDDTAVVLLGLRRAGASGSELDDAVQWTLGMQSRNGGWGAFDADNTRRWPTLLPFCDFGEVTDPPSADVSAHAIEMLAGEGLSGHPDVQAGIKWLLAEQEDDGSWFGRWGVNHVYGTGAVVPALIAAGVRPDAAPIRRAVDWLGEHQQPDGGWGEDIRSYCDPEWRGRGATTASQTAWALLALLAAGQTGPMVDRGVAWLVGNQTPEGSWNEPQFTGTGFPNDFSINYHLYRLVFPISALGRYVGRAS
jgi:squalene-hopene/tetraprenyl-beta-curcumene cyclase